MQAPPGLNPRCTCHLCDKDCPYHVEGGHLFFVPNHYGNNHFLPLVAEKEPWPFQVSMLMTRNSLKSIRVDMCGVLCNKLCTFHRRTENLVTFKRDGDTCVVGQRGRGALLNQPQSPPYYRPSMLGTMAIMHAT